ncbi:hypothetical protein L3Y34_006907 [Caenorhabditis briggsae]|uniref:Nuclear Hormone Receptor family n=1 Tax=Caenorhabditis briggsae TaxID=6238 RepID=A0AAE9CZF5_CAEBR|nr:hypothetical protein L3Y34_006907 [Caenorhabditis briggsae]
MLFASKKSNPFTCHICARPAHGHHYNVLTCKGCKTFFRRQCLLNISEKCDLHGDCFDLKKRNSPLLRCRPCRFQKCKFVGMKPECVQYKEPSKQILVTYQLNSLENKTQRLIGSLNYVEWKLEVFRRSSYNPHWHTLYSLDYLIRRDGVLGSAEKYGPMPGWPIQHNIPLPESQIRNVQGNKKYELAWCQNKKVWSLFNMLTIIEYMKTFDFFDKLSAEDKFLLARHTVLPCLNLHVSYFSLMNKCDGCLHPDGTQQPLRDEVHYSMTVMPVKALIRIQMKPVEYVLVKAICLCNPAVSGLSSYAQSLLLTERQKYTKLLSDYSLQNHGPGRLAELLGIFFILERQQELQKNFYLLIIGLHRRWNIFIHDVMVS